MERTDQRGWLDYLDEEDRMFVKRLVLASGSLKRVAREYGVSYPTVRARLDRLIAKIEVVDQQHIEDEFERLLRIKLAEGKLDAGTMRALLEAHRRGGRS